MYAILRGTPPLLVLGVTFALCCAVHAVPNDRDEKRNDDGGNNSHEQYYSSFQAHINNKLLYELYKSAEEEADPDEEMADNPAKTNSVLKILIEKIYYNELDYARLQNDNNDLKGQKRKLEDDLKEESCKKAKIEKKLKESVAKNQEITCKFQKKFKRLVQGLLKEALPKIKPFQITTKGINLELEDN
ncbi:hypothetical protein OS493_018545 [Desmophyllum pertusum]|uniref:Uncharacterized protein n=1 Tax=Desmophyllum pertusum TaxID=174260 RepID=A0A9X0D9I4_9CNID|nr:hypothetical protein OS493_018545 [Desmophyllum pertusum]